MSARSRKGARLAALKNKPLYSCGPSKIVPYKAGESWQKRHERRRLAALEVKEHMRAFCKPFGVTLLVTPDGSHWKFKHPTKAAEWWPETARLLMHRKNRILIRAFDYMQVKSKLAEFWGSNP